MERNSRNCTESVYIDTTLPQNKDYDPTVNREYYIAHCLYKRLQNKKEITITIDTFSKLLQCAFRNVDTILDKYLGKEYNNRISDNNIISDTKLVSDDKRIAFTINHAIPVLNYLNELVAKNSDTTRYILKEDSDKRGNKSKCNNGVFYHYIIDKTDNNTDCVNPFSNSENCYFSIQNIQTIAYYKMSKWAYLLHVYLINMLQKLRMLYQKQSIPDKKFNYFILELDAKAVWTFWHNSPIKNNSYYSEFAKAVEELDNTFLFTVGNTASKVQRFVLPNASEFTMSLNNCVKLYTIHKSYQGKYYIYMRNESAEWFSDTRITSVYPKELAAISPKTSYCQIRLFEYLYSLLDYLKENHDNTRKLSISEVAIATGKLDIAYGKVRQHLKDIKPTESNYADKLYHYEITTKSFAYDFNRFFLKPNIKIFNAYLKNGYQYEVSLVENTSDNPTLPSVQFSLVPLNNPML